MPWQAYVLDDALKVKPDGKFARRRVGLMAARQNGKSHVLRMRVLAGLFLWDETWVSMAQNRMLALEQFQQAMLIVESTPWLKQQVRAIRTANGKEGIDLKSGATWRIVAATKDGARGFTGNLWIDELRDITPEAYKAATPITRAVPGSQIWMTSNAGDVHSTVLNEFRARALTTSEPNIGWYEWSADPDLAYTDQRGWLQANPSAGHTIDLDVIAEAAATDKPEAFMTESLCLQVDSIDSPWPIGAWDRCEDKTLDLGPGPATWLAVDVSPDRRRADLVAAQHLEDGRIALGLVASWRADFAVDDLQIAQEVAKWARHYNAQIVAFDRYTGAAIASRLASAGIPVGDLSGAGFAQGCDETANAMAAGRLAHAGQPELSEHILACVRKPVADGGWRIIRRGTNQHISAACAAVMVVHHATQPPRVAEVIVA